MSDAQKSKERLQNELKQLVEDIKELLGSTADVSDKTAKAARARVEESLQSVQDQVEAGMSAAGDKVEEQLHVLDKSVRDNPYVTVGISFGVGALLGFIIGHK